MIEQKEAEKLKKVVSDEWQVGSTRGKIRNNTEVAEFGATEDTKKKERGTGLKTGHYRGLT